MTIIIFSNLQIYEVLLGLSSPLQVEFDQPVTFKDAHGRLFPVPVQWIDSWEIWYKTVIIRAYVLNFVFLGFRHNPKIKVQECSGSSQDRKQRICAIGRLPAYRLRPAQSIPNILSIRPQSHDEDGF